jgi:prepilin-type N-terminal cleavage/methylation domain-containing protein
MTKRQQLNLTQSQDAGYTIIESIVAMVVVSVLMIAIAPVMAFSVATRVQARRTELATQAARAYIDALRTGAIKHDDPQRFPGTDSTPGSVDTLYCIDLDGNPDNCSSKSSKDFRVHGVRNTNVPPKEAKTTGYGLTVRVYRSDASGTLTPTGQSIVGAGLGNPNAPLVVMSTEIPPSPEGGTSPYRSLCDRTGGCK